MSKVNLKSLQKMETSRLKNLLKELNTLNSDLSNANINLHEENQKLQSEIVSDFDAIKELQDYNARINAENNL